MSTHSRSPDATDAAASAARDQASRHLELSAFELRKSVSDYVALQLLDARAPAQAGAEAVLSQVRATLETRLSALQPATDPGTLGFTWKAGTFDSPASDPLAE